MTNYKLKRTIVGQLPYGSDLYDSLTQIVQRENITLGRFQAIGATMNAAISYYDQTTKKYIPLEFSGGMEIVSCSGNVSLRDGKPFVHAHIALSDAQGKTFGGHLMQGTKLFACEMFIDEFWVSIPSGEGEELVRAHDERTGLYLWKTGMLI